MPRRKGRSIVRDVGVDAKYGSPLIQKFINVVMERGKKSVARSIVYGAIDNLAKFEKGDEKKALEVFHKAFEQVAPLVEVRARRVGGSVYQIPTQVPQRRARALALRWLIEAAGDRSNKTMAQRLASELKEASEGRGGAVKKRTEVQKMAESNRAFSHYSW